MTRTHKHNTTATTAKVQFIPMNHSHIDQVHEIQAASYIEEYHESKEAYELMIEKYSNGCFVIQVDHEMAGYIIMHDNTRGTIQKLNETKNDSDLTNTHQQQQEHSQNNDSNCWYIHDCCLIPKFRGIGLADKAIEHAMKLAKKNRFEYITLVSVMNTYRFWEKKGWERVNELVYGSHTAYYMERYL